MKDKVIKVWGILKRTWHEFKDVFSKQEIINKPNSENLFNSLAPASLDPNDVETYLKALNSGILDKSISNIALTGSYGSGKSSLIKTFEENSNYNFLKISLASFDDTNGGASKVDLERQIELSILQQIFYHVKADKIPDSRFKRIKNITKKHLILFSVCFSLWLLSTLIIFNFDYIQKLNPVNWSLDYDFDFIALSVFLIFFSGIAVLTKSVIRFFNNSKISKVSLKGELEVGKDIDKSILNQYLDELIYFFERNHYDIVVIEDLDRFNSVEIFTKLREINTLINNSEQKKGDVVFLYAIRDDIFTGKDRTKFFDFILPVIPVINKSNSNEKLKEKLNLVSSGNLPSDKFIDDVALFVDDMRLLNNICNEYVIYKNSLSPRLIQDKLLAMIVYKNMRPDDFVDLHNGLGKLFDLINRKKVYITNALKKIEDSIEEAEIEIEKIENENFKDVKELRSIYINALNSLYLDVTSITINGRQYAFKDLIEDDAFELLKKTSNYIFNQFQQPYSRIRPLSSNKSFKDLEDLLESEMNYEERVRLIEGKKNDRIYELKKDIEDLKELRTKINSSSLKEIFEKYEPFDLLPEEVKKDKLTLFFIRNGYIDENYYDYISYFHEFSITRQDYEFLQCVKSEIPNDFNYKLNKIDVLVDRIDIDYFRKTTILNFDLFDFIFRNIPKNKSRINLAMKLFMDKNERALQFFESYIENGLEVNSFIKFIGSKWKELWKYIDEETKFTNEKKEKYLKLLFENSSPSDIKILAIYSNLEQYLNKHENPVSLLSNFDNQKNVKDTITRLKLKFKNLVNPKETEKELFNYVFENKLYEINVKNIELFVKRFNKEIKSEDINKSNYTSIIASGNNSLIKNIDDNIEYYIDNVYLKLEDNYEESEKALIKLLNNGDITDDKKGEVLQRNITVIDNLDEINRIEIKERVIENESIAIKWKNVLSYYKDYEKENLDSILVDFLNKENVYKILNKYSLADEKEKDEFIKEFSLAILNNNELEYDAFSKLVPCTPYTWNSLVIDDLDKDKVEWLVSNKVLNLTSKNHEKLKDKFSDLNIQLIELNFDKFLRSFEDYQLGEEEIIALLKSDDLSLVQKNQLIEKYDDEFLLSNDDLSSVVTNILSNYKYKSLSFDFINGLFSISNSNLDKIKLFNLHAESLSEQEAKKLVAKLTAPYDKLLESRKHTRLKVTKENSQFVDCLLDKGIVSSKDVDKHRIKVIAKY